MVKAVGAAAIEALSHIRAGYVFHGRDRGDPQAGLSTGDIEEAYVKRALAEHAAETVVLASAEKLNAASCGSIRTYRRRARSWWNAARPRRLPRFQALGVTVVRA